jgi:conjugative transfer signal peptidase TraF
MTRLKALWPLWTILCVGLAIPMLRLHFFYTASAPIGLWRAVPNAGPRIRDVARFCMRAEEARLTAGRPYAGGRRGGPCPHHTWMLAKPVIATAGDTVVHTPDAVSVNGRALPLSGTRTRDSRGLAVPVAVYGTYVLDVGEYWVHSPYADGSFDSRYLGVVRAEQLRGTMRPVLTWLTPRQRTALRARGLRAARCGLVACVQRVSRLPDPLVAPLKQVNMGRASNTVHEAVAAPTR